MKKLFALLLVATAVGCAEAPKAEEGTPKVYMTTEITPEGLMRVYEALGIEAEGNVAVKISTGEPGGKNYLKPELIGKLTEYWRGRSAHLSTIHGRKM